MNYRLAVFVNVLRVTSTSEHLHQFRKVNQDDVNLQADQGGIHGTDEVSHSSRRVATLLGNVAARLKVAQDDVNLQANQGGIRGVGTPNDSKARSVQVSTGQEGWCCGSTEKAVVLKIDCDIGQRWQGTNDYLMMYVKGHKNSQWYSPTFQRIESGDMCNVDWLGFGGYFWAPGGNSPHTQFCLPRGGEIVLEIQGGDALMVDKIYFDVMWSETVWCDKSETFSIGSDNEYGMCLSTDPGDVNAVGRHAYGGQCTNALLINVEDRTLNYFNA